MGVTKSSRYEVKLFLTKELARINQIIELHNSMEIVRDHFDKKHFKDMYDLLLEAVSSAETDNTRVVTNLGKYLVLAEEYNIYQNSDYSIEIAIDKIIEKLI